MIAQPGLCRTWSETPKTGFLTTRLKYELQTGVLDKLLYAVDMEENAQTKEKIQGATDQVSQACDNQHEKD